MQQVGRALDQAVAGRERLAEFQEAAALTPRIGKIGREIIQRPFLAIAAREHDPHPARGVLAGIFVGKIRRPLSSSATGLTSRMVFPERARKT